MAWQVFEHNAAGYDAWYDSPVGAAVLAEEADALRPLLSGAPQPWLEVGVGSGRFAAALGAEVGIDPAAAPLALARRRGCRVAVARGEALPFPDATFGAVLLIVTLCFVADPAAVLREARRVVHLDGRVVLGVVPAEGPWGRHYRALAAAGHRFYAAARFSSRAELAGLLAAAGLAVLQTGSALFWPPAGPPVRAPAREGDDRAAGFVALALRAGEGGLSDS